MVYEILSFLLEVVASLLGGACLLRLYMQWQRVPFGNPVGRFVFAFTNWLVLPLRRVLPTMGRIDTASLLSAYLVKLLQFSILWGIRGGGDYVPVLLIALFGVVKLAISAMTGLVIVYAILSWVQADSPMGDVIDRLCAPLLRPFRRVIPLVGGIDLSPLALLVVLQVAAMVVGAVAAAVI